MKKTGPVFDLNFQSPTTMENDMANQTQGNNDNSRGQGFQNMDDAQQRKIAQKGGEAVSRDREHMADIGRKGGEASSGSRGSDDSSGGERRSASSRDDESGDRGGRGSSSGRNS